MLTFASGTATIKKTAGVLNASKAKTVLVGDIRVIAATKRLTFLDSSGRYGIIGGEDLYFTTIVPNGDGIEGVNANGQEVTINSPVLVLMDKKVKGREDYFKLPTTQSYDKFPGSEGLLEFYGNVMGKSNIPVIAQDGSLKRNPITNKVEMMEVDAYQNLLLNIKDSVSLKDTDGNLVPNCWTLELVAHTPPVFKGQRTNKKVSA